MGKTNTTRGASFDPAEAIRDRAKRTAEQRVEDAAAAKQRKLQEKACYDEHMPAQRRWLGYTRSQEREQREQAQEQDELLRAAAELGIDLELS